MRYCATKATKRATFKNFPPVKGAGFNTIMATLKDLFSAQQLNAIKAVVTSESIAEKYAPSLLDFQREDLYEFAAKNDVVLDMKFWKQIELLHHTSDNVIVCVCKKHVTIEHMSSNNIFARHIGEMLKRGTALFFVGISKEVTWDNWKGVYSILSSHKNVQQNEYELEMSDDEYYRIKTARRKEKEFYDLARPIRSKKGGRIRITFEEARERRVRIDRLTYESHVEARARQILAAL